MIFCFIVCLCLCAGMVVLRRSLIWQKIRNPCRILLLFGVLGLLAEASERIGTDGIASGRIERRAPGGGAFDTEAYFYLPGEDTEYPITLTIEERKYQKTEEQQLLAAAMEEIDQTFCGTNPSPDQIVSNPVISESYQNGAVSAEWTFSKEGVISTEGEICQQALKKKKQEIEAFVTLSCGESEEIYRFLFWIVAKAKSSKEKATLEIQEQIALQEETEAVVKLPDTVNGQKIEWRSAASAKAAQLLGLGVLAAIAFAYAGKEQQEKQIQKRKQSLFLAYPEFVSKLSLLLGAGMSISGALRKMNQMYQKKKANGLKEEAVYEELYQMVCEMDNGMGELRAYQAFSERCDLQPYRKLVSLLVSSQKVGSRKLMEQLNEEADRVFLERKNTARRLGEEAGTKMLLPMMMMMVIVMGIVIIPAFLSIYGK